MPESRRAENSLAVVPSAIIVEMTCVACCCSSGGQSSGVLMNVRLWAVDIRIIRPEILSRSDNPNFRYKYSI